MKKIKALWDEILDIMEEHIKGFSIESLEPGVKLLKIQEAEEEMEMEFPKELKALYLTNNGTLGLGAILGFELMPLEDLITEWKHNKKNIDSDAKNEIRIKSNPEEAIRLQYLDDKWIPFAFNNSHTYLAIDLNPDAKGNIGQIINIGNGEGNEVKYVLAESLDQLLTKAIIIYEYNGLSIDEDFEVAENLEEGSENLLKFMDKHLFDIIEYYKSSAALFEDDREAVYNNREYDDHQDEDGYADFKDDEDNEDEFYGKSSFEDYDSYEEY